MQNFIKSLLIFTFLFSFSFVFADNFDITNINYSSPEAIDIIFAGDGFTSSEQAFFITKAVEAEVYLMNSLPFNSRKSDFNTYRMELNSNESGISVLGGVTVDNFLGSYKNKDGMMRYTGLSDEGKEILHNDLRKRFKKKVYVILILNDSHYGGSGEFLNDDLIGIAQSNYDTEYNLFRELVMHEFGHSFGNLADEYGGTCDDSSRPNDWDKVKYNRKNVTLDPVNDRKWDFLSNPQYILGANYCDTNWYRSSNDGLMRSLHHGTEHNELGQYLINKRIDEEINYNNNLISFIENTTTHNIFPATDNVRIHADSVTFEDDIYCDELYIAKNATLYMNPGKKIHCNSIVNLGDIVYKKRSHKRSGRRIVSKEKLEEIFSDKDKKEIGEDEEVFNNEKEKQFKCNIDYHRLIKFGEVGEDVKQVQECLNSIGYYVGPKDGIFGIRTFSGIKKFQSIMKLSFIDGIIGSETIKALTF